MIVCTEYSTVIFVIQEYLIGKWSDVCQFSRLESACGEALTGLESSGRQIRLICRMEVEFCRTGQMFRDNHIPIGTPLPLVTTEDGGQKTIFKPFVCPPNKPVDKTE